MTVNQIDPAIQEQHDRAMARRVYKQMRRGKFTFDWVKNWAAGDPVLRDELNKVHKEYGAQHGNQHSK